MWTSCTFITFYNFFSLLGVCHLFPTWTVCQTSPDPTMDQWDYLSWTSTRWAAGGFRLSFFFRFIYVDAGSSSTHTVSLGGIQSFWMSQLSLHSFLSLSSLPTLSFLLPVLSFCYLNTSLSLQLWISVLCSSHMTKESPLVVSRCEESMVHTNGFHTVQQTFTAGPLRDKRL